MKKISILLIAAIMLSLFIPSATASMPQSAAEFATHAAYEDNTPIKLSSASNLPKGLAASRTFEGYGHVVDLEKHIVNTGGNGNGKSVGFRFIPGNEGHYIRYIGDGTNTTITLTSFQSQSAGMEFRVLNNELDEIYNTAGDAVSHRTSEFGGKICLIRKARIFMAEGFEYYVVGYRPNSVGFQLNEAYHVVIGDPRVYKETVTFGGSSRTYTTTMSNTTVPVSGLPASARAVEVYATNTAGTLLGSNIAGTQIRPPGVTAYRTGPAYSAAPSWTFTYNVNATTGNTLANGNWSTGVKLFKNTVTCTRGVKITYAWEAGGTLEYTGVRA